MRNYQLIISKTCFKLIAVFSIMGTSAGGRIQPPELIITELLNSLNDQGYDGSI